MAGYELRGPDFLGIGVMRAGTSWIDRCLKEHPRICIPPRKELHFFDRPHEYDRGIDHYLRYFAECPPENIKGEYTPAYVYYPEAAERIRRHFPEVKLICCVRNPMDRAYSHYAYALRRKARLSCFKSFREALEKDGDLLSTGFYSRQLQKYYGLFPRERIRVAVYEDIARNPVAFIQGLYAFLGLEAGFIPPSVNQIVNKVYDPRESMHPEWLNTLLYRARLVVKPGSALERAVAGTWVEKFLRKLLRWNRSARDAQKQDVVIPAEREEDRTFMREVYRSDIQELEKLLGRDLSFWT